MRYEISGFDYKLYCDPMTAKVTGPGQGSWNDITVSYLLEVVSETLAKINPDIPSKAKYY